MKKPGFDKIHVLNRAQIVSDAMNLARAGVLPYVIAMDTLSYLENEVEYYPWYSAFTAFKHLLLRFNSKTETARMLKVLMGNYA